MASPSTDRGPSDPPERHPVLSRQLEKLRLTEERPPVGGAWPVLLDRVDGAYEAADRFRYLAERSSELASEEMRELHQRAAADKRRLQTITDSIANGILGLDPDGTVAVANPAALRLLARTQDETVGVAVEEVLAGIEHGGGTSVSLGRVVHRQVERRERWSFDSAVLRTASDARYLSLSLCFGGEDGPDTVATLVLEDSTADVLADHERQRRQHLEAAVAHRDDQIGRARRQAAELLEHVNDIVATTGPEGSLTWASPALARTLGYAIDDLAHDLPGRLPELVHPDDLARMIGEFDAFVREPGTRRTTDARVRQSDGRYRWLEIVVENRLGDPDLDGYVICARDIDHRVRQVELLETHSDILELISGGAELETVLHAVVGALLSLEPSTTAAAIHLRGERELLAVAAVDEPGRLATEKAPWSLLAASASDLDPGDLPSDPVWAAHRTRVAASGLRPVHVHRGTAPAGDGDYLVVLYGPAHAGGRAGPTGVPELLLRTVGLALVNDRHRRELERQASHDPLTGLPNRWQLHQRLLTLLSSRAYRDTTSALLFVDLDDLKRVNDSLGHEAGDELLRIVADRLRSVVRHDDLLCRFGGDEFVVVCEDLEDPDDAHWMAARILDALRDPIDLGELRPVVTASIGLAFSGPGYDSGEQLVRDADAAMYEAKSAGRDCCAVFDDAMRSRAVHRLDVETRLRQALDERRIVAHFQPQFDASGRRIVAIEALARWDDPEHGLAAPGHWLDVAEESGLIATVGEHILEQACDLACRLDAADLPGPPVRMSVNVAASQLDRPTLVHHVVDNLTRTGLRPDRLCLEITESSLADLSDPADVLADLKALGLRIALDDWGTGYSSLDYLRQLPVDELKVDRTFVRALDDADGVRLMGGICQLGRALDLELVAEGVETKAQMGHVRAFRFDLVQGFLLARPMAADAMVDLMTTESGAGAGPTEARPGSSLTVAADVEAVAG